MQPNQVFDQIGNIIYIIIYTICIVLFYTYMPSSILEKYSYINSFLLVFSVLLFYKGLSNQNQIYLEHFNITAEQIKMSIAFICLIVLMITFYVKGSLIGYSLIITIMFAITLFLYVIILITTGNSVKKDTLLVLFGIMVAGLFIGLIIYYVEQMSVTNFVLNILLLIVILGIVYKTVIVELPSANSNVKKNAFFSLIINILFYIPCLASELFNKIGSLFTHVTTNANANATANAKGDTIGSILMVLFAILLIALYILLPYVFNYISTQGGNQLVNRPVYTNTQYTLGTYSSLNGSDDFDYQYALSCWIFIDASPPNTNSSYNKYTSLLNFGYKPNILYNGQTNTLMITMQQKDLQKTTNNKLIDFDEQGNRIIYINKNILLQKWNNLVINYNGGTLDVFLNGLLVKSSVEVVPYYSLDNLTIGENDGIQGGICNVVYFRKALDSNNIYYIYNTVKYKDPPVLNDSAETILVNNTNQTINSF